ncbi:MAG TPA: response regulator [Anaerolineales bacterium]|nr:response regulator [Anaerolineales bacterium]
MKNNKILLVEDSPDDQELIRMAFEDGHVANEFVVVSDGVQALDYLFCTGQYAERDITDVPVVILLDLKLPKVGGLEVLQKLRADPRTGMIPVVILTSSDEESDVIASYRSGVNSYVRKPVDFNQFADAVKQLKFYWLILNEAPPIR